MITEILLTVIIITQAYAIWSRQKAMKNIQNQLSNMINTQIYHSMISKAQYHDYDD